MTFVYKQNNDEPLEYEFETGEIMNIKKRKRSKRHYFSAEAVIKAWQTSNSRKEVVGKLGIKYNTLCNRIKYFKAHGVKLKKFNVIQPYANYTPAYVKALNKLAAKYLNGGE